MSTLYGRSGVKPNITAPGYNIRSSILGGYAVFSGRTLGAPHLVGGWAILKPASPSASIDALYHYFFIAFSILDKEQTHLKIFDVCGRLIYGFEKIFEKGNYKAPLNIKNGVYFLILNKSSRKFYIF